MPSADAPVDPAVPAVGWAAGVGVWAPAAELVQAPWFAERTGKPADVEVGPPRAVLVDGPAVHGLQASHLINIPGPGKAGKQHMGHRLHEPRRVRRTPRDVDHGRGNPLAVQELLETHAPGRVGGAGGDPPVGSAAAQGHRGQGVPPQRTRPVDHRDLSHVTEPSAARRGDRPLHNEDVRPSLVHRHALQYLEGRVAKRPHERGVEHEAQRLPGDDLVEKEVGDVGVLRVQQGHRTPGAPGRLEPHYREPVVLGHRYRCEPYTVGASAANATQAPNPVG